VIVLFHHFAVVVAPVQPEFLQPLRHIAKDLQPARTQAVPNRVQPGFNSIVSKTEFEPELAVIVKQLAAIRLSTSSGSRINKARYPFTGRSDTMNVYAGLGLATLIFMR
jgi:hypothetical protein